ncbi:unnamed protein product [Diatraea saccharalis]|uniref:Uncharacterized protein n=1 Tax=Diatraea saccharalis TaxID=40085 RepID=A0A9N9RDT7_9NEOP|nr:unnamed protein product [Diatraea saccharalis]
MFSENKWKVILLVAASAAAVEPTRALSLVYQKPYRNIMFVPRYRRRGRQSRVLFLDDAENHQNYGKGEIDLTLNSKVKFDDSTDYEFTSPEIESTTKTEDLPSGNERFYEPIPRFRQFQPPQYYQGRYGRPYAPNFGFDPYQTVAPFAPALRNSFYGGYNGWKARSPRVVFPYASDSVNSLVHTNSHGGPGFDNVVFREQNFANEVGTDEQSLQDINGGSDAFTERGEWLERRL